MDKNDRIICRCEEILESQIRIAVEDGCVSVREVKIATRAGMGTCQGNTCSSLIRGIIAEMTNIPITEIVEDSSRYPSYPVKLGCMAEAQRESKNPGANPD